MAAIFSWNVVEGIWYFLIDFFSFRVERSSDQVIKPVNLEALSKWVGQIPEDVVRDMADIAPMLSVLGYDPYANPPNYGKPDKEVADNTNKIKNHVEEWEQKAKDMFNVKGGSDEGGGDTALDKEPSDNPNNFAWYYYIKHNQGETIMLIAHYHWGQPVDDL